MSKGQYDILPSVVFSSVLYFLGLVVDSFTSVETWEKIRKGKPFILNVNDTQVYSNTLQIAADVTSHESAICCVK